MTTSSNPSLSSLMLPLRSGAGKYSLASLPREIPWTPLDIASAVHTGRGSLSGDVVLTLFPPTWLSVCVRRVITHFSTPSTGKLPHGATIAALLRYGLRRFESEAQVQDYAALCREIDTDTELPARAYTDFYTYLHGRRFGLSERGAQQSYRVHPSVVQDLGEVAGEVGVTSAVLGVVCIMGGMKGQSERAVPAEFGVKMEETYATLVRDVEGRGKMARSHLEGIRNGTEDQDDDGGWLDESDFDDID